jgi:(1->4)-alpha-D-glucan 1-alpha-D-glucosylmutase
MSVSAQPRATCRLQLRRDFDFAAAAAVVPYLARLGISHVYCSPYLKARAGSPHGYDIVDHNAINPELGGEAGFDTFCAALAAHGMSHILDLVPNHMGVGGDDNPWWLEVLEHGQGAPHAGFFDIDWRPVKPALAGKVLLPVLGGHYGSVLENGELQVRFDRETGRFSVHYHHHCFPIDPATCPAILAASGQDPPVALAETFAAFSALPARETTDPERRRARIAEAGRLKQALAGQYSAGPRARAAIDAGLAAINGKAGDPSSFDALHALLERQAWRLAFWQVAADEINYRRFFDINDLAGLRMERREVFDATHARILDLVRQGRLTGLRIDHPDGLHDPAAYYQHLVERLSEDRCGEEPVYIVVEKILAGHEYLPEDWPVAGTTGYDFAWQLGSLFVDPAGERPLTRSYRRFTGMTQSLDELIHERKHLVIRRQLSSELTVLANLIGGIAECDRETRDFTLNGLREALAEVTACFPVYRTYVAEGGPSEADRRYIDWAVSQAVRRSTAADPAVFDFIRAALLLEAGPRDRVSRFAMKFQQYTAPVTAKAIEDTVFYIYNRLVSLNEVGGDPRRFGLAIGGFHHLNQERLRRWPQAMLNTSTHDNKRSEDVRARINVLSELPDEWRRRVSRWRRLNRNRRRVLDDRRAPSDNDEYLVYQTLIGVWPLATPDERALERLRERLVAYMIKAVREAKVHTSWINPDREYEQAVEEFLAALLQPAKRNVFLSDFTPFAQRVARFGLCNSLAQAVLKFCVPGVPDLYQGNELWTFRLVDPDNRAPVDYALRERLLDDLRQQFGERADRQGQALRTLFDTDRDGRAKLYLTWRALQLRAWAPALFRDGDYQAVIAEGERADQACAFMRRHGETRVLVIAPRFFTRLSPDPDRFVPDPGVWADTVLPMPGDAPTAWRDVLSGEVIALSGERHLGLGVALRFFPVALLTNDA